MIRDYWNDPRSGRWKPASIADLDTRAILGGGGQVWYGATWINVPAPTELEFQFQSHPQTQLRWTLNGEPVTVPATAYKPLPEGGPLRTQATKKVTLRAGWNQVAFRGYCGVSAVPRGPGAGWSAPFEEIPVPADSKDAAAMAARTRLIAALAELNPAAGHKGKGSGRGDKTNTEKKKADAAPVPAGSNARSGPNSAVTDHCYCDSSHCLPGCQARRTDASESTLLALGDRLLRVLFVQPLPVVFPILVVVVLRRLVNVLQLRDLGRGGRVIARQMALTGAGAGRNEAPI